MRAYFLTAVSLIIPGVVAAPAHASTIQAYTGVIGGSNTLCAGSGGPVPAISAYFQSAGDFGVLTDPGGNSIGDCGLSGGISSVTGSAGPQTSTTSLASTPYASYPANSISGTASATANYGSVSVSTSTDLNGVEGPNGQGESVAFGIVSDTLNVVCAPTCASGYLAFDFTLNATVTVGSTTGGAALEVDVQAGDNANESIFYGNLEGTSVYAAGIEDVAGTLSPGQPVPGCVTGTGTFTCTNAALQTYMMPVTFTPGLAFSFGLIGETNQGANETISVDPPDMSLSGIQVYDASGNLVSDFTITSGSGSTYGADGFESGPSSSAPEPGTFLPMMAGIIFLAFRGRRFLYLK
jgi:hypothetical protein